MKQAPKVELTLFFATDTDRAVILRRGPSRQIRMISWRRSDDRFEDGQWLRQKVYVERCRLSPDGRHFLYFILDGKWGRPAKGSYTGISRPPFWTALALHPQGDTWGGGGWFVDNARYYADGDADIVGRAGGPAGVTWVPSDTGFGPAHRANAADVTFEPHPSHLGYATEGDRLLRLAPDGTSQVIRDFTDMTFEPVRAPYDWRDPDPAQEIEP